MMEDKNKRIILIFLVIILIGGLIYIMALRKDDENNLPDPKQNENTETKDKITQETALKAITEEGVEYVTTRFEFDDKILKHDIHGDVYVIHEIENETSAEIATYYVDVYTADIRDIKVSEDS